MPPGQHVTAKFPVFTAGQPPELSKDTWSFTLAYEGEECARWDWDSFQALPQHEWVRDIHCVTRWSRPGTRFQGVRIDDILAAARLRAPASFVMAHSFGGYETNLAWSDLTGNQAMIALRIDGTELDEQHGGPARLIVPHLYFWKSAKWIAGLRFLDRDQPGFWERHGYHMRGDPWLEQRRSSD